MGTIRSIRRAQGHASSVKKKPMEAAASLATPASHPLFKVAIQLFDPAKKTTPQLVGRPAAQQKAKTLSPFAKNRFAPAGRRTTFPSALKPIRAGNIRTPRPKNRTPKK